MTKGLVLALAIEAAVLGSLLVTAADQVAHTRVEKLGGVNVWGYRGPVLHQKKGHEVRIAVTGGDLAFGWGVAASETLAPSVRDLVKLKLDRRGHAARLVTSVTTAARGLPLRDYASWIDRYAYLRPDVICIVPDPAGHRLGGSAFLPDRRSVAFTAFGYSPILPLVLEEKGIVAHSALLRAAGRALAAVDAAMAGREEIGSAVADDDGAASSIDAAVRAGLRSATAGVVVVLAPSSDGQALKQRLASAFAGAPLRVVDLADDPSMLNEALRLDGFSFSTGGHAVAAQSVAPAVLTLIGAAEGSAP